jgi:hypothetical protein
MTTATCRFTLTKLGELADDALAAADLSTVRAHLAICAPCAKFLAGYVALARVARVATAEPAPADAVQRALAAVRRPNDS